MFTGTLIINLSASVTWSSNSLLAVNLNTRSPIRYLEVVVKLRAIATNCPSSIAVKNERKHARVPVLGHVVTGIDYPVKYFDQNIYLGLLRMGSKI